MYECSSILEWRWFSMFTPESVNFHLGAVMKVQMQRHAEPPSVLSCGKPRISPEEGSALTEVKTYE